MGVLDLTEALKITNSSPLNKSYHPSELPQFLHLENESLNEVETTFPSVLKFYVYMILLRVQRGRNQCIDYLQCREWEQKDHWFLNLFSLMPYKWTSSKLMNTIFGCYSFYLENILSRFFLWVTFILSDFCQPLPHSGSLLFSSGSILFFTAISYIRRGDLHFNHICDLKPLSLLLYEAPHLFLLLLFFLAGCLLLTFW